ncbi:trypsin-like serine peptidase [Glaciimonas immobilis]|uniref:Serine protease n=1 Tax=Glaciimonas immobilis TaxID=728004 RepID=A0A840RZJ1_9BURK|nr:trypsin-like peptidase domain-containing protein [Glaciimonas immobilis]KAF3996681.1 trypsin-like peptidase domain-containing protein [Glaciimonas immobilis]MBB5202528.1 hypothetical protein [Glaciimonas immobilis]
MNKLIIKHIGIVPLMLLSLAFTASESQAEPVRDNIGVPIQDVKPTKLSYGKNILTDHRQRTTALEIKVVGSAMTKLYFSKIVLPKGAYIEISDPSRTEVYLYGWRDFLRTDARHGAQIFSPTSISGETALVKVVFPHGVTPTDNDIVYLDHYETRKKDQSKGIIDGQDERIPSICYKSRDNGFYQRSQATAFAAIGGYGTTWAVGNKNFMMTNNHVAGTNDALANGEIWFNYRADICSADNSTNNIVKIKPGHIITAGLSDWKDDYSLYALDQFDYKNAKVKALFGGLRISEKRNSIGDTLYIPQHGNGGIMPQKIAATKSGEACKVLYFHDPDHKGTRFNCDVQPGTSGSPALSQDSNEVMALVWGSSSDSNVGVSSWYLWDKVKSFIPADTNVNVPGIGDVLSAMVSIPSATVAVSAKSFNNDVTFESFEDQLVVHYGNANNGYSTMVVEGKDVVSGDIVPVTYRLAVESSCGIGNLTQSCASSSGTKINVSYKESDNLLLAADIATTSWIPLKVFAASDGHLAHGLLIKIANTHPNGHPVEAKNVIGE